MQDIKNFTPYKPESPVISGAAHLKSEDGHDWYECHKLFSPDTIKVEYDNNGVITCISRDISGFWPVGKSVAEVPDTEENRRADISGGWKFKDGKVVQRVYSPEELRKKAEAEKVRCLAEAESAIAPLARAVKMKIATDEEIKRLEAWELYSVMVNRVDTANPDWPEKPE